MKMFVPSSNQQQVALAFGVLAFFMQVYKLTDVTIPKCFDILVTHYLVL